MQRVHTGDAHGARRETEYMFRIGRSAVFVVQRICYWCKFWLGVRGLLSEFGSGPFCQFRIFAWPVFADLRDRACFDLYPELVAGEKAGA